MALTATVYPFSIQLANVDRAVYADLNLRLACHPSETLEFMLTRLLAYCLEYEDGILFTAGVSAGDEPAVLVRDLTGRITAWIEVGAPDAERLHRGIKLAGRAAVYTHRDPAPLLEQLAGRKIHRAAEIPIYSFERDFLSQATRAIERRNTLALSFTGDQLYLELNGQVLSSARTEHRLS
jgi:uncharacterized protein YaeQ